MKERREQRRKKEESHTIKQTKFHNNLNGLKKYSLTFGEQPQRLRKTCSFIHFFHSPSSYTVLCSCSCTVATLSWVSRDSGEGGKGERGTEVPVNLQLTFLSESPLLQGDV